MTTKYKLMVVFTCIVALVCCSLVATITLADDESDNGNIIYAAYQKVNGMLRIINDPSEAKPSEGVISWYKAGTGLPGPGYGEQYLWLSPAAFQTDTNNRRQYSLNQLMINPVGIQAGEYAVPYEFHANVNLPNGAVVKELTFLFTDGNDHLLYEGCAEALLMYRVDPLASNSELMAVICVKDHQEGIRNLSTSTINLNVIDNEHYFYIAQVNMLVLELNPSFRGVRIKYELPMP